MKKIVYSLVMVLSVFLINIPINSVGAEQLQDEIIVNGVKINDYPIVINDCNLVPAREVCAKLGFTIIWNNNTQSATIQSDTMATTVNVGEDLYVAHSIEAIGMTAPVSLGSGPILINNKLYVPAELFRILQGNNPLSLTYTDNQIIFSTINNQINSVA